MATIRTPSKFLTDSRMPGKAARKQERNRLRPKSKFLSQHLLLGFFLVGLVISVLMLVRSQVSDDGLHLLSRGWLLATHGVLAPIGNASAERAGGFVPGSASAIVTGVPLMLWMDHRAPVVLILITHVIAYVLLDRVVDAELGQGARVILAIVFWLNPWRLYQSGWVDNSNFLFLPGAIHLWSSYAQRDEPRLAHSAILVTTVGVALQLHVGALLLVIASVLLWLRGYWKPHWGGVAIGSLLTLATLVPYAIEAYHHPEVLPGGAAPLGLNLVKVWPVLKGFLYWLRYPSLNTSNWMTGFDFVPAFGVTVGPAFTTLFRICEEAAAGVSMIFPVLANLWWLGYTRDPARTGAVPPPASPWLSGYALWLLAAWLTADALSPDVVQWWHNLVALHASLIPVLLWTTAMGRTRHARLVARSARVYAAASILLCLGMALGSAHYRRGGYRAVTFPQAERHQMIEDLGLNECCTPNEKHWKPKQMYFYRNYLAPYVLPEKSESNH